MSIDEVVLVDGLGEAPTPDLICQLWQLIEFWSREKLTAGF
jgi:hypothetical protein